MRSGLAPSGVWPRSPGFSGWNSRPTPSETGGPSDMAALRAASRALAYNLDEGCRKRGCVRVRPATVWYVPGSAGGARRMTGNGSSPAEKVSRPCQTSATAGTRCRFMTARMCCAGQWTCYSRTYWQGPYYGGRHWRGVLPWYPWEGDRALG